MSGDKEKLIAQESSNINSSNGEAKTQVSSSKGRKANTKDNHNMNVH